jgi:hypothetical protein
MSDVGGTARDWVDLIGTGLTLIVIITALVLGYRQLRHSDHVAQRQADATADVATAVTNLPVALSARSAANNDGTTTATIASVGESAERDTFFENCLIASSECGCNEEGGRVTACSHISIMAYFTEPSWRVVLEPFERRVVLTIGDRTYGDSDGGDEDVMQLNFSTPTTLHALGSALIESSRQLKPIVVQHRASHSHARDMDTERT